ncbi:hypothetical protein HYT32_01670 [Candidatus Roizmanbacteria bacterium]|nr:hypothetical protein [Candidatus Roizmanbacteria bacterium]
MTDKELGEIYGSPEKPLTGERIRQIRGGRNGFIKKLHRNSSDRLQARFPLEELSVMKPTVFRSEVTSRVAQQVEQGITNRHQIAENTGLTSAEVTKAAHRLKEVGIEIPRVLGSFKQLEQDAEIEEDDKKLQEILNNLSVDTIIYYFQWRSKDPKAITVLTKILKNAGLHIRTRELKPVRDTIRDVGIPIRFAETSYSIKRNGKEYPQSYTVVFTKHIERILLAIRGNPDVFKRLNDNPVALAYGPEPQQYPTTTDFRKGEKYVSVGTVLWDHFRFRISSQSGGYNALLNGCRVSVFKKHAYYCRKDQENDLVDFLRERLREFGKIK